MRWWRCSAAIDDVDRSVQARKCPRGDSCPYAHNVFEYWLHPSRYRTQLCKDGAACARRICFFAHSPLELRADAPKPHVSPEALASATAAAALEAARSNAPAGEADQVRPIPVFTFHQV